MGKNKALKRELNTLKGQNTELEEGGETGLVIDSLLRNSGTPQANDAGDPPREHGE